MVFICGIKDLKAEEALGRNVNLKFLATRGLLLVGQIQPKVLALLLAGSAGKQTKLQHMFEQAKPHFLPHMDATWGAFLQEVVDACILSKEQLQLWHASLLCFWCLLFAFC